MPTGIYKRKKRIKTINLQNIRIADIKDILYGHISKITGMKKGQRDRIRELVRMRDNFTCQRCGIQWIKGERRFDVHHKDCDPAKTKQSDSYEETDNMVVLCHRCHLNLPEHIEKMTKIRQERHK